MIQIICIGFLAFVIGFGLAWFIHLKAKHAFQKEQNRTNGLLESERLVKETLRKESATAFLQKERVEAEYGKKLQEAQVIINSMDQDIILLQKSNEETEALLLASQPELYNMKLKLIEANNTIARLKAQLGTSGSSIK